MGEDDLPVSQLVFEHRELAILLDYEASGSWAKFYSYLGGNGHGWFLLGFIHIRAVGDRS
jgi:hypothetical protein